MFCSHHWREINIKINGSLCSLGNRYKVYMDKSSSCIITYTAELAKKKISDYRRERRIMIQPCYTFLFLLVCTLTCSQDKNHKNLQGRRWSFIAQLDKLGNVEINGIRQGQHESEGLSVSAVSPHLCWGHHFVIWLLSHLTVVFSCLPHTFSLHSAFIHFQIFMFLSGYCGSSKTLP